MYDYDWLVIGSGPAGEKGAVQAAYFGRRVAVVEKQPQVGGACINTGTLPPRRCEKRRCIFPVFASARCTASPAA